MTSDVAKKYLQQAATTSGIVAMARGALTPALRSLPLFSACGHHNL